MISIYPMNEAEWDLLIHDAADYFNDAAIDQGYDIYEQGLVRKLTMTSPRMIEAEVGNDAEAAVERIEINLDFFSASQCTCGAAEIGCAHLSAVLMEYATLQGRNADALLHARLFIETTLNESKTGKASARMQSKTPAKTKEAPIAQAIHLRQLKDQGAQIPTMTVNEWHTLFKQRTASLSTLTRNSQFAREAIEVLRQLKPSLPPRLDAIYELHVHLSTLKLLTSPISTSGSPFGAFVGFHTQVAITDVQKAISSLFEAGLPASAGTEDWPHVIDTLAYLREQMLAENKYQVYFLNFYFWIWTHWLRPNINDASLFLEELRILEAAGNHPGEEPSGFRRKFARSWMNFYLLRDQAALALLQDINDSGGLQPETLTLFYSNLSDAGQWSRLREWLVSTRSLMEHSRHDFYAVYFHFWDDAVGHLPEAEPQMWEALAASLPHAGFVYEEKLLQYSKWEQWIDLQLSLGRDPLEYRASELAPIEKHAPEALLPFYHQAVERYVLFKNRAGYKTAVKLLKRLARIYKKTKNRERWERFITAFAARNSRLRALQEELRKGSLIS